HLSAAPVSWYRKRRTKQSCIEELRVVTCRPPTSNQSCTKNEFLIHQKLLPKRPSSNRWLSWKRYATKPPPTAKSFGRDWPKASCTGSSPGTRFWNGLRHMRSGLPAAKSISLTIAWTGTSTRGDEIKRP